MATINGTDPGSYVSPVTVPVPGAEVKANDVIVAAQALANQTKYLNVKTDAIEVVDAAQDATLDVLRGAVGLKAFPFVSSDASASAQWDTNTGNGTWTQIDVAGINRALTCPIILPTGSIITRIDVWITGGAHGATPAVMPAWYLYQVGQSGGTLLTSKSDPTAIGFYTSPHAISKTPLSITIDNAAYVYTLQCYGEAGANSAPNVMQVFMAEVYFTPIA